MPFFEIHIGHRTTHYTSRSEVSRLDFRESKLVVGTSGKGVMVYYPSDEDVSEVEFAGGGACTYGTMVLSARSRDTIVEDFRAKYEAARTGSFDLERGTAMWIESEHCVIEFPQCPLLSEKDGKVLCMETDAGEPCVVTTLYDFPPPNCPARLMRRELGLGFSLRWRCERGEIPFTDTAEGLRVVDGRHFIKGLPAGRVFKLETW